MQRYIHLHSTYLFTLNTVYWHLRILLTSCKYIQKWQSRFFQFLFHLFRFSIYIPQKSIKVRVTYFTEASSICVEALGSLLLADIIVVLFLSPCEIWAECSHSALSRAVAADWNRGGLLFHDNPVSLLNVHSETSCSHFYDANCLKSKEASPSTETSLHVTLTWRTKCVVHYECYCCVKHILPSKELMKAIQFYSWIIYIISTVDVLESERDIKYVWGPKPNQRERHLFVSVRNESNSF